jgi:hypothetical protein
MSTPCPPEHFRARLYDRRISREELEHLRQSIPPEMVADALLTVFSDPSRPMHAFRDQAKAGQLLLEWMPPCQRPLVEVLRNIAPCWNVSVEELPRYLSRVFGRDEVIEAATALFRESGAETMKAIIYWLGREYSRPP